MSEALEYQTATYWTGSMRDCSRGRPIRPWTIVATVVNGLCEQLDELRTLYGRRSAKSLIVKNRLNRLVELKSKVR